MTVSFESFEGYCPRCKEQVMIMMEPEGKLRCLQCALDGKIYRIEEDVSEFVEVSTAKLFRHDTSKIAGDVIGMTLHPDFSEKEKKKHIKKVRKITKKSIQKLTKKDIKKDPHNTLQIEWFYGGGG